MLIAENYFSPENRLKYIGASQFKAFLNCESAALAEVKGDYRQETTVAMLVGSYVDAHFEGTLDIFKAQNPEIFTKQGSLKSEYKQAEYIIERVSRDEMFMRYMAGEKQKIMTGEIDEVPVKIKIDSYHMGKAIVDLKVMKDMKDIWADGSYREFWEAWGYAIQGSFYREIVRQNTGDLLNFYLAVATKEKEPDIDIIKISESRLDFELEKIKANIRRFDDIKKGTAEPTQCGECPWCRSVKVLTEIREVG